MEPSKHFSEGEWRPEFEEPVLKITEIGETDRVDFEFDSYGEELEIRWTNDSNVEHHLHLNVEEQEINASIIKDLELDENKEIRAYQKILDSEPYQNAELAVRDGYINTTNYNPDNWRLELLDRESESDLT